MITPDNLSCIIPTHNAVNMLNVCLATMKYYVPELKNVYIIDRNSQDNSQQITNKYGYLYYDLATNPKRELHLEHIDSILYALNFCNTEWILLLHNDIEFVNFDFWNYINENIQADLIYSPFNKEITVLSRENVLFCPAPKTSFILIKKDIIEQIVKYNISFESRFEKGCVYDVFYDIWKWTLDNDKINHELSDSNFYIHYWGYSAHKFNPIFSNDTNVNMYNQIIDKIISIKLNFLNNSSLPFPQQIQNTLMNALEKCKHY